MGNEKTPLITRQHKIIIAIHDTYYHTLLGIALYLTLNETDAKELVASTIEKVCRWPLAKLEEMMLWDKPRTLAYLSSTLNNTHIDTVRKKQRRKQREEKFCEIKTRNFERSTEATYLSKEKITEIQKAYFEVLEKEDKIIRVGFYLRTNRGFKNKEIARLLKISPNTIGSKFHRLRLKIREKIS